MRTITSVALVVGVAGCAIALIVRGALDLRGRGAAADVPAQPRAAPAPAEEPASARQIGERVLSRNIFDSVTGALGWELEAARQDGGAGAQGDDDAGVTLAGGRCTGDLRLLGSVVHGRDPSRSIAVLRKDGKTSLMTMGERLGELELVAVHPTEAYFRRDGREVCSLPVYLSAYEPPPPPPPEAPPEPPPAADAGEPSPAVARRPPAFSEEELKRNIRALGPARFAVTRELFTRARLNPSGVSRGARFRPQEKDGRALGMQVFKIRDDSLLAHLGVKQGDVLRGINGFSLTSADGVLEAFGHLGKDATIALSIERDGKPATIEYLLE